MKHETNPQVVLLSSKKLNDSGIKTSLNQNDLVEIIAEEKYEHFLKMYQAIKGFPNRLMEVARKVDEKLKDRAVAEFKKKYRLSKDAQVEMHFSRYLYIPLSEEKIDIRNITVSEKGLVRERDYSNHTKPVKSVVLQISYSKYSENKTSEDMQSNFSISEEVAFPVSLPWEQEKAMVEEHNANVEAFVKAFEGTLFNPDAMAKKIRREVNRHILRNQAPELKAAIDKIFNIEI